MAPFREIQQLYNGQVGGGRNAEALKSRSEKAPRGFLDWFSNRQVLAQTCFTKLSGLLLKNQVDMDKRAERVAEVRNRFGRFFEPVQGVEGQLKDDLAPLTAPNVKAPWELYPLGMPEAELKRQAPWREMLGLDDPDFTFTSKMCRSCGQQTEEHACFGPGYSCPDCGERVVLGNMHQAGDVLVTLCDGCTSWRCISCGRAQDIYTASASGGQAWPMMGKVGGLLAGIKDSLFPPDRLTYPGSEPWKRAAIRKGYQEETLRNLYEPATRTATLVERATRKAQRPAVEREDKVKMALEDGVDNFRCRVDFKAKACLDKYDDEWYKENFHQVLLMAIRLAEKHFGQVDFPAGYDTAKSPWLEELPVQFIRYANLVAHEDKQQARGNRAALDPPVRGPPLPYVNADPREEMDKNQGQLEGWSIMMKSKRERQWLVVGILGQIIQKKIFSSLLFGATPAEQAELEMEDSKYLGHEGYQRTKLRAAKVNIMLGHKLLPDHFWAEVDELAAQTTAIFLPLTNVLNCFIATDPANAGVAPTTARVLYQQLHGLLAHAGFMAVTMRRSETVFQMLSATPGSRMDFSGERQMSYEIYRNSKERSEIISKTLRKLDEMEIRPANNTEQEQARVRDARRINEHGRIRGAKVKYAVWPGLTRYTAHEPSQAWEARRARLRARPEALYEHDWTTETDVVAEREAEGQWCRRLLPVSIVYYQGLLYPPPPTAANPHPDGRPLLAHVEARRGQLARRTGMVRALLPQLLLAPLFCLAAVLGRDRLRRLLPADVLAVLLSAADQAWQYLTAGNVALASALGLLLRPARPVAVVVLLASLLGPVLLATLHRARLLLPPRLLPQLFGGLGGLDGLGRSTPELQGANF